MGLTPDDPRQWSDAIWHLSTLADHAPPKGSRQEAGSPSVEDRLERLALICMAMWNLIQTQTSLTEDDLLEQIKAIDLMDGSADGKLTRQVTHCPKCNRPMSSRHTRCIYCGHINRAASAFDTV